VSTYALIYPCHYCGLKVVLHLRIAYIVDFLWWDLFATLGINVIVIVIFICKRGPVMCSGGVSAVWYYFTYYLLQL
jgi:hypothetical protein